MKHDCDYCDCEQWKLKVSSILHKLEYPEQINHFKDGDFIMINLYKKYLHELLEALDD